MSVRPEKKSMIADIRAQIEKSDYVFLADFRGLTVERMTDLRGRLRGIDAHLQVVSNAFLRIAAGETGWTDLEGLTGPTAIVTGSGEITRAAKVLTQYVNEFSKPTLKSGRMRNRSLTAQDIQQMAMIPPRDVLLGRMVGSVAAPMFRLVGVMGQKVSSLLYALKAIEEKKGKQ